MNRVKEIIKKKLSSTIDSLVDKETYVWPPECLGFAYQPIRPSKPLEEKIGEITE